MNATHMYADRAYCSWCLKVELLAPLSSREREKVAEALEELEFKAGEVVCRQGDKGDTMFILRRVSSSTQFSTVD